MAPQLFRQLIKTKLKFQWLKSHWPYLFLNTEYRQVFLFRHQISIRETGIPSNQRQLLSLRQPCLLPDADNKHQLFGRFLDYFETQQTDDLSDSNHKKKLKWIKLRQKVQNIFSSQIKLFFFISRFLKVWDWRESIRIFKYKIDPILCDVILFK